MTTPIKFGTEIPVNTTTLSAQDQPAIAALATGRFVAVWRDISQTGGDTSGQAVRAQLFNADGSRFGNEFLINTVTANDQYNPAIVAINDGRFIVTWSTIGNGGGDTSQSAVSAQIFNSDGGRIGAEFQVNTTTAGAQNLPTGTSFADGRTLLTWTDFSGSGDTAPAGIRAQYLAANGSKLGAEFLVNSTTVGNQVYSAAAALSTGHLVIAWADYSKTGADTSSGAIRARLFDVNGAPLGSDFVVNATTTGEQLLPRVTALAAGRFVVTWTDFSQTAPDTSGYAVRGQLFNYDGSRAGSEFLVSTTTADNQFQPVIATLADGRFVAAWLNEKGGHAEVHAQVFNADGTKAGEQFVASGGEFTYLYAPTITALPDGRFVVGYIRESDQSSTGIAAQIFDPRTGPVSLSGTALEDQLIGSRFDDTIGGSAGNDQLRGEDGNDILVGGAGADALDGGAGIDTASYVESMNGVLVNLEGGNLFGDAAGDILTSIENVVGSAKRDVLSGDAGSNVLSGLGGDDKLEGRGGDDTLIGHAGANELFGGAGDDTAVYHHRFGEYGIGYVDTRIIVVGPDNTDTLSGIEHLRFSDGTIDLNDGTALFDTLSYLRTNLDVYHAGMNALDHYNTFGRHEGRDPNAFFDTSGYLAVNKDVAAAGINPLEHYHNSGWREGRDPSAYFDTTLYLLRNPDVAAAGIDPLEHYLAVGFSEGRVAHKAVGSSIVGGFDAQYYLFHNPDVAAAGVDPLFHFNVVGWQEGRDPNAFFDTSRYLSRYTDVAAAGINPLQHYEMIGWKEGRNPSGGFDTSLYLIYHPDVAAADVNPLDHYLQIGIYEGRVLVVV